MSQDLPNNNMMEEEKYPPKNSQSKKPLNLPIELDIDTDNEKFVSFDTFICPITQDILSDPVIATDGFTYERTAIEKWQRSKNKSPMTNKRFPSYNSMTKLRPNLLLKAIMQDNPVLSYLMRRNEKLLDAENDKKVFAKAVFDFYKAMKQHLAKNPPPKSIAHHWDKHASETFVATIIHSLRKEETIQTLIDNSENYAISKEANNLLQFIGEYINTHPNLKKAQQYPHLVYLFHSLLCKKNPDLIKKIYSGLTQSKKEEKYIATEQTTKNHEIIDIASSSPKPINMENFNSLLTLETMTDPVTTVDGHTYDRKLIMDWFTKNSTSPKTNKPLLSKHIVPNRIIKSIIEADNVPMTLIINKQRFFVEQSKEQVFGQEVINFIYELNYFIQSIPKIKFHGAAAITIASTVIKRLRSPETYRWLLNKPEESSIHPQLINYIKSYVKNHPILLEAQKDDDIRELAGDISLKLLKGNFFQLSDIYDNLERDHQSNNNCCIL